MKVESVLAAITVGDEIDGVRCKYFVNTSGKTISYQAASNHIEEIVRAQPGEFWDILDTKIYLSGPLLHCADSELIIFPLLSLS